MREIVEDKNELICHLSNIRYSRLERSCTVLFRVTRAFVVRFDRLTYIQKGMGCTF